MSIPSDEAAAASLFERRPSDDYINERTALFSRGKQASSKGQETAIVIFRLHQEWLALPAMVIAEIIDMRVIRKIPHRTDGILLGMTTLRGQLQLCISLHHLLEVDEGEEIKKAYGLAAAQRMIAIEKEKIRWVFPVDEIFGVFHCNKQQFENVPVTISKSKANFLKDVFKWEGRSIGLIDENLLFYTLQRKIG